MDEIEAKQLVMALINAACIAGKYSSNPDSLILEHESKKAILLSHEIIQHLTKA